VLRIEALCAKLSTVAEDGYLLDNSAAPAEARLAALAELFDPWTFRHMEDRGLTTGWRCWEVGAGGPSVARGLAERVGVSGRVLATDIDVSWAAGAESDAVEVRRHDVGADDPPDELFDLIHARLVLVHVVQRDEALASMVRCLAPGGWLLVEDADPALQPLGCLEELGPAEALANKLRVGFRVLLAERGVDLAYGRSLPRRLREAGLSQVGADAYFPITFPASSVLEITTMRSIGQSLVEHGLASSEEIARHLDHVLSGRLDLATSPLVSAWGQRAPG
jgi:SAM-dependent methyltransferase